MGLNVAGADVIEVGFVTVFAVFITILNLQSLIELSLRLEFIIDYYYL